MRVSGLNVVGDWVGVGESERVRESRDRRVRVVASERERTDVGDRHPEIGETANSGQHSNAVRL